MTESRQAFDLANRRYAKAMAVLRDHPDPDVRQSAEAIEFSVGVMMNHMSDVAMAVSEQLGDVLGGPHRLS